MGHMASPGSTTSISFQIAALEGLIDLPMVAWLEQDPESLFRLHRFTLSLPKFLNHRGKKVSASFSLKKETHFSFKGILACNEIDDRQEAAISLPLMVR